MGTRSSSRRTECIRRDRRASYVPRGFGGTQDPTEIQSERMRMATGGNGATHVWAGGITLEVRLDRLVLLVEESQVGDQVLDDVGVRQRVNARLLGGFGRDAAWTILVLLFRSRTSCTDRRHTQAGQSVDTVNVHGTATTDTLTAGSAEGQGRVQLVLYPDEGVQDHGAGLVEVELVVLHGGLLARLVRVPAVDLEGLHVRRLGGVGVDSLGRLDRRIRASKGGGGPEQRPRSREQTRGGAEGGHGGRTGNGRRQKHAGQTTGRADWVEKGPISSAITTKNEVKER